MKTLLWDFEEFDETDSLAFALLACSTNNTNIEYTQRHKTYFSIGEWWSSGVGLANGMMANGANQGGTLCSTGAGEDNTKTCVSETVQEVLQVECVYSSG